ncbi:LysE family translocator [Paenimyroides tangerinum]|uniref:LysE family translocator n=1 Tax=Paenimyroides tangerinum TaxID=2488728 RepID=A0A3P3WC89_9FLAO|nr:LysE family translocator [Paenimyroides tangerinum]RRJ92670.1 LysE family translocator [Paenimyroides tangerinum]
MTLDTILSFFLTSLVLTIAPGPDVMYVLSQSISKGRNYGIAAALGLSSGLLFHTTLLAFGISTMITAIPWLFQAIKIFGALYLLWIAYNVFKSPASFHLKESTSQVDKPIKNVTQGLIMNISNPKVMLFFLALFPTFLNPSLGNVKLQVYTLGSIFMIQALIVFVLYAIIASSLTLVLRESKAFNLILKWLQIVVFVTLAFFMFF